MPSFTTFDIVILIIIALFTLRCAVKGFTDEFFSKAAVICGCIAALLFFRALAPFVFQITGKVSFAALIAFVAIFFVVYFVIKIVQGIIADIFFSLSLTSIDCALGIFLGLVEGLLVAIVVTVFLVQQPFFDPSSLLARSFFAELFRPFLGIDLFKAVPNVIKKQVSSLVP